MHDAKGDQLRSTEASAEMKGDISLPSNMRKPMSETSGWDMMTPGTGATRMEQHLAGDRQAKTATAAVSTRRPVPTSTTQTAGKVSCGICRRMKVKCDKAMPGCRRCFSLGRNCPGYEDAIFVNQTVERQVKGGKKNRMGKSQDPSSSRLSVKRARQPPPQQQLPMQLLSPEAYRLQLASSFIESYLPPVAGIRGLKDDSITSASWIYMIPHYQGSWKTFDMILSALSVAYCGDTYHDERLVKQGQTLYAEALKGFRTLTSSDEAERITAFECTSAAAMLMAMYELFHCTYGDIQAWLIHVDGAIKLLTGQGPHVFLKTPRATNLLRRARTVALWRSYAQRTSSIFATPQWLGLSNTNYDRLIDILTQIPAVLEDLEYVKTTLAAGEVSMEANGLESSIHLLLARCRALESSLLSWYFSFQSQMEGEPMFVLVPISETQPSSSPFQETIRFHSPYLSQILVLYWFGEVTLNHAVVEMIPLLQKLKSPSNKQTLASHIADDGGTSPHPRQLPSLSGIRELDKAMADALIVGGRFATKLCQAVLGYQIYKQDKDLLRDVFQQLSVVPLWAAQNFFDVAKREPQATWCRLALADSAAKGFPAAQALSVYERTVDD